jgi:hypothetical protein
MTPNPDPEPSPHETWRNRDYDEATEAKLPQRRWLRMVAMALSLFMLLGLLWGIFQPFAG